ncbi:RING finger protein 44 [Nosema bombycis CQ1]|uniref:RING-type E3 ubiquitin transferase n=1 Tax=Nosema bombycis (strain CQ1 / CVCC 102059) TaxID=578461 RepID=R0MHL8_NOSB1|nr:RING finger protein 44 [Nosema bombycis CQ1]|eukprot:EOB13645.1 RING finger protein 44 [Nosema bombycis CQ1]
MMIFSFFIFFYIILASSMNRKKTSFFLKHDNHDTSKYSFCTICLENYQDDEFIMVLFCEHNFHYECVSIWLDINNSCPICKKDLEVPITLYEDKELQM